MSELNPHHDWNWRRKKKEVRNRVKALTSAGYFMDCRGHPCELQTVEVFGKFKDADIEGTSLIDGTGSGCSVFHCAPDPLAVHEAIRMARS